MPINCCAIIPTFNHFKTLERVIEGLRANGLTVFVVDDGSGDIAAGQIKAQHQPDKGVTVLRLNNNQGKGAAFEFGARNALQAGFSHALQIDADGQHDLSDIPALLAAANRQPDALITAKPVYDDSMPLGRRIGRWVTHFWVWIETLSFDITDSMCGFRIYPIAQSLSVMSAKSIGRRMDFDTSIMVHLYWRGCDVIEIPSKVIYPPDNTSNFDVLADNVRISWMHTKLVFGLLGRLVTFRGRRDR